MMSDASKSDCEPSDVIICVGVVLMTVGVAALGVAYLFPYDNLTANVASAAAYNSAREIESAEIRERTIFIVLWTTGLSLIAASVIVITCTLVYANCCGQSSDDEDADVIPLSGHPWTHYGSSDSELIRGR